MDTITYGCSVTNKSSSGNYNYYLYSRIDNYSLILREKTDGTEYLFRVINPDEVIATVFAAATTQTYVRPDEFSEQLKKYITNKTNQYLKLNRNTISSL